MSEMIVGKIDLGKAGDMPAFPPPPPSRGRTCIDLDLRFGETVIESKVENGHVIVVTSNGRIFKVAV